MADLAAIFSGMKSNFNAEKASGVNATVQFDLSGDGGGLWYAEIADGSLDLQEGKVTSPSATISMDADDFEKMSNGELNAMMAFMSGKIKVQGDLNTVMQFQSLVGM